MTGRVGSYEKCPICRAAFDAKRHPSTNDVMDLICDAHQTRPRRYYIDARGFGAGRIFKDTRGTVFHSFLQAHRQLEEMRRQVDTHTFDASRYETKKLREYRVATEAEAWLAFIKRERSAAYHMCVKTFIKVHVVPHLGEMDARDVRRKHIDAFAHAMLEARLSRHTVKSYILRLSALWSWIREHEEIDLPLKFPRIAAPVTDKGWINRQGQDAILEKIASRHRLIFETMIATGCRPAEIAALKVRDLEGGELLIERSLDRDGKIKETKTGRVWYKSIPPDLYAKLEAVTRNRFPDDFIFKNRFGLPYRTSGLSVAWKKASKEAGLPISLYHGTRRSHAAQMRKRDENEMRGRWAKEMGHGDARTTETHYAMGKKWEQNEGNPAVDKVETVAVNDSESKYPTK